MVAGAPSAREGILAKPGRPTRYNSDYDRQAYHLCLLGATDKDLARAFEVTEKTINTWKQKHRSFLQALKAAKEEADARVVESLFKRATGYEHTDVHFTSYEGEVTATEYIKRYPPDTVACIFWLKNRRPQDWRDKQEHQHSGSVDARLIIERPEGSNANGD